MRQNRIGKIFLSIYLDPDFFSRLQKEDIDLSELAELGIRFLQDFEDSGRCFLTMEREKVSASFIIRESSYLQIFEYCLNRSRSIYSVMEEILQNTYLEFYLQPVPISNSFVCEKSFPEKKVRNFEDGSL
ncbi:hypothetical protein [Leptospira ainlahdjerensis]|jgi:hypothetical protein|uniref:hypothetical protein n=1 Tax=Leptospira ainlahdjerensis TaxID=2810033 RepID=UPI001E5763D3|nr:hypothetical protein [Leptospira ainlahdjerensis]